MHETLLSVEIGDHAAVVLRTPDGTPALGERGTGIAIGLKDDGATSVVVGGRLVVAGLVPGRAASITVIDAVGDEYEATIHGAFWLVVAGDVAHDEGLVRYRDAQGAIVSVLPAGETFPVPDADEPCPVCGAVAWTQVAIEAGALIGCERCGFVVGGTAAAPVQGPFGTARRRAPRRRRRTPDEDLAPTLARAAFPVYGPVDHAVWVSRVSADGEDPRGGPITQLEVLAERDAGVLSVSSAAIDPQVRRPPLDRSPLVSHLTRFTAEHEAPEPRSIPARLIRSRHQHREQRRLAMRSHEEPRSFTVDGEPVAFSFAALPGSWGARREHDGVEIVLMGRGVDPEDVALERLGSARLPT